MNLPDPKALKKLAAACRKAGIKTYKCGDLEFTLTDEAPTSKYKASKKKKTSAEKVSDVDIAFDSDTLTEEQLLMWSTGDTNEQADSQ